MATYLASRRYTTVWPARLGLCILVAAAHIAIPVPGLPLPIDIVAAFPLVYGLGAAATLPDSLSWMGSSSRVRVARGLTLLLGSGTILAASIPLMDTNASPAAVVASALLGESCAMAAGRVRSDGAWIAAAVVGLALPVSVSIAGVPSPLYLLVPLVPAALVWAVAAAAHVVGSGPGISPVAS